MPFPIKSSTISMRLLFLVFSPNILPTNVSYSNPLCLKAWPSHLCLRFYNIMSNVIDIILNFLISLLVHPADYHRPSPDPHFKSFQSASVSTSTPLQHTTLHSKPNTQVQIPSDLADWVSNKSRAGKKSVSR